MSVRPSIIAGIARLALLLIVVGAGAVSPGAEMRPWAERIGADNPAKEGLADSSMGAESNPTGEPVGGGTGYSRIVARDAATTVVRTGEEFLQALREARAGAVIYVADDAVVDLTDQKDVAIPGGVTIAGGRGRAGSEGGLIYSGTVASVRLFRTAGPNIRITGVRLEGSYPGRERLTMRPILMGIAHDNVEVDNCEIFGWSCAAVGVGAGASEGTWVHHNYNHHNQGNGLGYGVSLGRTHVLIEGNLFDFCRHAIASSGFPGSGYTARYNVHLENTISHVFDMHGARDYEKYNQIGLWHFDEGQGDKTDDYSIYNNEHDGRLVGMDKSAWVEGRIGRALRFDGRAGYVDMGKDRYLSPKTALSIAAWVRPEAVSGTQAVFSKGDSGARGAGYSLRLVGDRLEGALYDPKGERRAALGGKVTAGQWHYVAMMWDGKATTISLDGAAVGAFECVGRTVSPSNLIVGRDSATATSFFRGLIDEARLYNNALKGADVVRQFQGNADIAGDLIIVHHNTFRPVNYPALTVRGRPAVGCYAHHNRLFAPEGSEMFRQVNATGNFEIFDNRFEGKPLAKGPDFSKLPALAHWNFDAGEGTAVRDVTGSGHDGKIEGSDAEKAWTDSPGGRAVAFDGDQRQMIVAKPIEGAALDRFAFGMRFRCDRFADNQDLVSNNFFRLFHRGGWASRRLYFLIRIQENARSGNSSWNYYSGAMTSSVLEEGKWYDLVGERDGDTVRIYLDGKMEGEEKCLKGMTPAVAKAGDLIVFRKVAGAIDDMWLRPASSNIEEVRQERKAREMLYMTGEKGYETDGVEPPAGEAATMFRFRVKYRHADGVAPAIGFPRVHILRDGKAYINEAPVTMMAVDQAPFDQGRIYTYTMRLPRGSAYSYFFEAEDVRGERCQTEIRTGPTVQTGSYAPVLSWTNQRGYVIGGVQPAIGDVATQFDFRILFSDLDGDAPGAGYPRVHIFRGKNEVEGSPFAMAAMDETPTYDGRPYQVRIALPAGSDYTYNFDAKDVDGNEAPLPRKVKGPIVDAGKDVAPPDLSGIRVTDITARSAVIRWNTDEPASGFVEYGPGADYGLRRETSGAPAGEHTVQMPELRPGTVYHYRVGGADVAGNRATSGDYTFETPK